MRDWELKMYRLITKFSSYFWTASILQLNALKQPSERHVSNKIKCLLKRILYHSIWLSILTQVSSYRYITYSPISDFIIKKPHKMVSPFSQLCSIRRQWAPKGKCLILTRWWLTCIGLLYDWNRVFMAKQMAWTSHTDISF